LELGRLLLGRGRGINLATGGLLVYFRKKSCDLLEKLLDIDSSFCTDLFEEDVIFFC